jgi:ABC-type antimicrobial peptide transport system permease subunit
MYVPLRQHYALNSLETLQIRTAGDPNALRTEIQRTIAGLAPELPIFDVKPMTQALYTLNGLLVFQIAAGLAAALGMLGLILAVVGVYGVISYAASQQTHEIGIRMALGARPVSVLGMILRQGLLIVGIGLAIGIGAALAAASLVGSFLAVSATDPLTYVTVSAILTMVALAACYVPARRAMGVDPMVALRHE